MRVAAMENWGLIICNQKHVVYNAEIYSVSERRQVTDLLSHEVAHQWFGNLVTMKWWNNLWLNEGFASMIGIKAADHSEGITVRMNEVSVDWNARVYRQDQTDRATPLTIPTGQIVDPERQFNLISYKKAAGLLRMIEFIVGEDIFRNGLRKYIKTHEYGNGDHEDLLRALSSVHDNSEARTHLSEQNFSLSNVVEKWIYQKGFPLVKVNKRGGEIDVWDVTQEHFQLYPSNSSLQWKIPLFARDRQTNTTTVQWLLEDSTVAIDLTDDLVLDREGRMYGRIQYDSWTYQRIIKALQEDHTVIPVSGRIRLLDDSFTFAEIGHLSYGDVFRLALYLRSEISYMPVLISGAHLEVFQSRFVTHPQNRVLQDYIQYLFIPLFHKFLAEPMSQDNVPIFQDNLREHVFMRVCLTGYKPCIDYTQKLFEKTRQQCNDAPLSSINCNVIPQFLRMPVYASAVLYGGDEAFEFLYRKWRAETYQMERDRIWSGMAASRKKEHIHRLFEDVLFEFGRREDFRHRCTDHGKFYPKENHFRSFVYENSERIAERFTRNDLILGYILVCFSRTIYEKDDLDLYQQVERRLKNASTRGIPESVSFIPKFIQALKFREHYEGMIFGNLTEVLNEGRMVNSGNDTKLERAYFESAVTTTEVNQVEEILENLVIDLSLINPKSSPFSSHPMMNDSINP
ncbi:unnamed protein product, partial [Mesorhabditis belari]|uniref:Aminopeptidase n=1 Tax=Mesorhabditis belari TaxID=2138241 RepID=A0AAF3FE56_9BILA